jgi:hypothetical protein
MHALKTFGRIAALAAIDVLESGTVVFVSP